MKLGRFQQSTADNLQYTVDYSNWLSSGETLTSATFTPTDVTTPALVVAGVVINAGLTVTFFVSGGVSGFTYTVDVEVTSSTGETKNDYVLLTIYDEPSTIVGQVASAPSVLAQVAADVSAAAASEVAAAASAASAAASATAAEAAAGVSTNPQPAHFVWAGPASGADATPAFRELGFPDISGTVAATQLPTAIVGVLGAVQAIALSAHEWVQYIDNLGVPHLAQPAFADISGSVAVAQLPVATSTALGVVKPDGTTVTISAGVISSTGGVSLSSPNTWTATQTITKNDQNLSLDTPAAAQNATLSYKDAGTFVWQFYKDGGNNLNFYSNAASKDVMQFLANAKGVDFNVPALFSGIPWADPTNLTWGATGNGTTNDTTAVQACINFVKSTYGGGTVFFPPGYFYCAGGLTIPPGITLIGSGIPYNFGGTVWWNAPNPSTWTGGDNNPATGNGLGGTVISNQPYGNYTAADTGPTLTLGDANFANIGIYNMQITNYQGSGATNYCIDMGPSTGLCGEGRMRDCWVLGGFYAIRTRLATDWRFNNIHAGGMTGGIFSNGANFYTDCKFDGVPSGVSGTGACFWQGAPYAGTSIQENQFTDTDLSAAYTYSLWVDDGATNTASTRLDNCVLNHAVLIQNARWTAFAMCEFGSTNFQASGDPNTYDGCYAFATTVVNNVGATGPSAGKLLTSTNVNLT